MSASRSTNAAHDPSSGEPYTHPNLSFETIYPGALDASTIHQACDFSNLASQPSSDPKSAESASSSTPPLKAPGWRSRYAPKVSSWTDWALIQALIDNESSADHGKLVGQCVVTKWQHASAGTILFVSQLLVHPEHRGVGVATALLRAVDDERPLMNGVSVVGIVHAHAAAIRAVGTVFGGGLGTLQAGGKQVSGGDAKDVLGASVMEWLRNSDLVEKTVDGQVETGTVIGVKTTGSLDEAQVKRALQKARDELGHEGWPLGEMLPEGAEWLLLFRI